jgi:glycosyltransferase involved in cell wall biosynthesis
MATKTILHFRKGCRLATDLSYKNVLLALLCFNEEGSIVPLLEQITQIQTKSRYKLTTVVFDNCSTDKTVQNAEKFFNSHPNMQGSIEKSISNDGYSGNVFKALKHFSISDSDYLLIIDGDGQFPVQNTDKFVLQLELGSNLVLTQREVKFAKDKRYLGTKVFQLMCSIILGTKFKDINGGFRAIDRKLLDSLVGIHKGRTANPLLYMIARNSKLKISWVSVEPIPRISGKSSFNFDKPISLALSTFIELVSIKRKKYNWLFE